MFQNKAYNNIKDWCKSKVISKDVAISSETSVWNVSLNGQSVKWAWPYLYTFQLRKQNNLLSLIIDGEINLEKKNVVWNKLLELY